MMICGVFQYGVLMFSYNTMLTAARDGARALAVGAATEADAVAVAKAALPPWVPADKWTITPQNTGTSKTNRTTMRITVDSADVMILPMVPAPASISAYAVMLSET